MSNEPQKTVPTEAEKKPVEVLDSDHIISMAYQSLDDQIAKLDLIPGKSKEKTDKLLGITFSEKNIFMKLADQLEFIKAVQDTSEEIGHAFQTILEIEREKNKPREPTIMPMPQTFGQAMEKPNPNVIVQSTPPKGGGWADYFGVRRWASAMEKIFQTQKDQATPQITTSRVIDILDYGRQLESEYMRLIDFYDKGIKRLSFFGDKETYQNQHQEIAIHIVKITSIICAFSRTIVEYRKERFGDRKVGVASGAMWLEGMKAQAPGMSIGQYYQRQRQEMGPQDVGS